MSLLSREYQAHLAYIRNLYSGEFVSNVVANLAPIAIGADEYITYFVTFEACDVKPGTGWVQLYQWNASCGCSAEPLGRLRITRNGNVRKSAMRLLGTV